MIRDASIAFSLPNYPARPRVKNGIGQPNQKVSQPLLAKASPQKRILNIVRNSRRRHQTQPTASSSDSSSSSSPFPASHMAHQGSDHWLRAPVVSTASGVFPLVPAFHIKWTLDWDSCMNWGRNEAKEWRVRPCPALHYRYACIQDMRG